MALSVLQVWSVMVHAFNLAGLRRIALRVVALRIFLCFVHEGIFSYSRPAGFTRLHDVGVPWFIIADRTWKAEGRRARRRRGGTIGGRPKSPPAVASQRYVRYRKCGLQVVVHWTSERWQLKGWKKPMKVPRTVCCPTETHTSSCVCVCRFVAFTCLVFAQCALLLLLLLICIFAVAMLPNLYMVRMSRRPNRRYC